MLSDSFNNATITNILIIDDDFSDRISIRDLELYGGNNAAAVLQDEDDDIYSEYVSQLVSANKPAANTQQLASALSDEGIRNNAPDLLRKAANNVLERRGQARGPVEKIKSWLIDEGRIEDANIDIVFDPEDVKVENSYDLILVDFYLRDEASDQSKTLIRKLVENNRTNDPAQLYVLMSLHDEALSDDFSKLKTEFSICGSRFRILGKPDIGSSADKLKWIGAFKQLADERSLVLSIENFISKWGEKLVDSANEISHELWGLDANSLEILRYTALTDHADFKEYVALLLSRHILTHIETNPYPKAETQELERLLETAEKLRKSVEINDSHITLQKLLSSTSWHGIHWYEADSVYPSKIESTAEEPLKDYQEDKDRFDWFMRNISFGTVLKHKTHADDYLVNLTQSCDKAHVENEKYDDNHVLLFGGKLEPIDIPRDSNHSSVSGYYLEAENHVDIHWDLRKPRTPTIKEFLENLESYDIVGQLRNDYAQSVINKYAATISRVASISVPSITEVKGAFIVKGDTETEEQGVNFITDNLVTGFLYIQQVRNNGGMKSRYTIRFEPDEVIKIISMLDGQSENTELQHELLSVTMDAGKDRKSINGSDLIIYFTKKKINLSNDLQNEFKVPDALDNAKKGKIALILWR